MTENAHLRRVLWGPVISGVVIYGRLDLLPFSHSPLWLVQTDADVRHETIAGYDRCLYFFFCFVAVSYSVSCSKLKKIYTNISALFFSFRVQEIIDVILLFLCFMWKLHKHDNVYWTTCCFLFIYTYITSSPARIVRKKLSKREGWL